MSSGGYAMVLIGMQQVGQQLVVHNILIIAA
jgi:hypothetical protein